MKKMIDYQPMLQKVCDHIVADYEFRSEQPLKEVYKSEQKIVTILNHSTPLSWLPAVCVLSEKICLEAAGGDRIPVGVMDKFFFQSPLFKPVASYLTQFNALPSFEDIIRKSNLGYTDVAIFPEGSNCFFGQGEVIQPFRSPRFIELALKMQAKIFIAVHRGSEDWAKAVQLNHHNFPLKAYLPGWLNEKIENGGFFVIPKIPNKIPRFAMTCEFYEPSLKIEDLSTKRSERMRQLWEEADKVRDKMQEMFDSLAS